MTKPATTDVPIHLGIILDGNRRWAKAHKLPTFDGHREGAEVFREIALATFERGIKFLSAWVFSTENWARSPEEIGYLMNLVTRAVNKYLDEFHKRGIKIVILGRQEGLESKVLRALQAAATKTSNNTKGNLVICFNYGGREEIVDTVKKLLDQKTSPDELTVDDITSNLYQPDIPAIDLVIRTSGEHRTSGFMLWRSDYAELYFTDKFWPDFTVEDLDNALADYQQRHRRFGS